MAETTAAILPGMFCWADLGTTLPQEATGFYHDLFHWTTNDIPTERGTYSMLLRDGQPVAGLFAQHAALKAIGVPAHWMAYVLTDDADAMAARARELGGVILLEPFDVLELGRMAVIEDPTGAHVALWQVKADPGQQQPPEGPGRVCWNELLTPDARAAGDFYAALFGWAASPKQYGTMPYTVFKLQQRDAAGMTQMPENPTHGPMWLVYFSVGDCDGVAARTEKAGGRILLPPTTLPEVGRFAVLADPQGAMFGIVR